MHVAAHQRARVAWSGEVVLRLLRADAKLPEELVGIMDTGSARWRVLRQQARRTRLGREIESRVFTAVRARFRARGALVLEVNGVRQKAALVFSG